MTKQEVRAIARSRKLPVAEKPDSQEICFVPTGSYREFIDAYLAEQKKKSAAAAGEVVSTEGAVLGEHQGIQNFTVGQRKGLGMAVGEPLYVISLDPAKNRVVVGDDRELFRSRFHVRDVNWIRPLTHGEVVEATVKIVTTTPVRLRVWRPAPGWKPSWNSQNPSAPLRPVRQRYFMMAMKSWAEDGF